MNAFNSSVAPPSAAAQKEDGSAALNGPQHHPLGMTHGAQPPHAAHDAQHPAAHAETTMDDSPASDSLLSKQKRRRVTRACDECRRKKIRCDGKQPCTHCTVYSYDCTYDQPSNRKRNPAPQYMEALENRLHKAEALLRLALPGLDLDGPRFEALGPEELLSSIKKDGKISELAGNSKQRPTSEPCDESTLESMVDSTGSLDLDDEGHWDYHGHSSGVIFVRRLRKQFGNIVPEPRPARQLSHVFEEAKSASESPVDSHLAPTQDLPSRDIARQLCANALDDSCCLMRFCHKPSFYQMFDKIYDTPPDQYGNDENSFLPLLYLALAVGCLFRRVGDFTLRKFGYQSAADQGFQYFKAGRQLLDVTECRDLTTLQAVCFMILFLQATSNIRTCYSYIGIALRASLRLGLHRSVTANFNPIEIETRKRTFWVIRKMDVHVSAILGLPVMLSEDDIDQEYPLSVDDEFITADGILPEPPNHVSLMAGVNAHIGLGRIVNKVLKYIYPVKILNQGPNHTYRVSHSKIRELERDLQAWLEALPEAFKPGPEISPEVERIRQLLRIGYAHVQMVMYRPFLHYFSAASKGRDIDKRSYACAAACVSVARNVVHITAGMKKKQLLNGSYWFTMYTTYFAILSLVYFILENPDSPTSRDGILKDALEGKNALAGLAKNSIAADRCAQSLNSIFKHLPERLRNQHNSNFVNKKRSQSSLSGPSLPAGKDAQAPLSAEAKGPVSNPLAQRPKHPATHHVPHEETKPQIPHSAVDDSHTSHYVQHTMNEPSQPRSSVPSLAESASETKPSSPASSLSLSSRQQSHQGVPQSQPMSYSPALDSTVALPDLMPIMFPSDDPFAYPNQPMSTLEDHHFKNDSTGQGNQFSFTPNQSVSSVTATPIDSTMGSAQLYEYFSNLQPIQNNNQGNSGNMTSMPNQLPQFSSQQDMPTSTGAPAAPGMQGNNNFYWNANANAMGPQSRTMSGQQDLPSNQLLQDGTDFGMGMGVGMTDFSNLGMDNGMQFDDIIGSLGGGLPGSSGGAGTSGAPPATDGGIDWNQWMDSRRWTSVDGS